MNDNSIVYTEDEKIKVSFPFSWDTLALVREIPDAQFNKPNRYWWAPATPWHADKIIDILGKDGFYIAEDVYKLAQGEKKAPKFPMDERLYNYQKDGVKFIVRAGGRCIIADGMGCVDGEAEVILNRAGKGFRTTIQELYDCLHTYPGRWDSTIDTYTRSVNEETGELRLNKILDVVDKGEKDVFRLITVGGKSLHLTCDHEVYTPRGWIRTDRLEPGDKIYVNGKLKCLRCGSSDGVSTYKYAKFRGYCRDCIYKYLRDNGLQKDGNIDKDGYVRVSNLWNHPSCTLHGYVVQHRLVVEAYINGVSYDAWISIIKSPDTDWDEWIVLEDDVIVHHKDGNKTNNTLDNLEVMTSNEHMRLHADPNRLTEFMEVKEDEVSVVIPYSSKRKVFDIVMEDPHHSFVANGIVVHNCGKTAEALCFVNIRRGKTLVVAPANVIWKWKREAETWTNMSAEVIVTSKEPLPSADIHICSYDIMKRREKELEKIPYDIVILDEFHYIKNYKAQRTRAAKSIISGVPHVLFLSGTPFLNKPDELFPALNMLDPISYPNFTAYAKRYLGAEWIDGSWYFPNRLTNVQELRDRLKSVMIRRTKGEVLKDLPDKTRIIVPVDIPLSEYKSQLKGVNRDNVLARLTALRQIVGRAKVKSSAELARSILQDGEQVVLFAHHKEVVSALRSELSEYSVGLIVGDTSPKARQEIVEKFLGKELNAVIISVAGAEGIDLYSASHIIFAEREWTAAKEEQAEDRLHRIGQKSSVTCWYVTARNTYDERMAEKVQKKRDVFGQVISQDEIISEILEYLEV